MVTDANGQEKSPFLPQQKPVTLAPSWEAQKISEDELNFRDLTMAKAQMTLRPPRDIGKMVFFIFLLHGLGTLMPWNMFITARVYFIDFKLGTAEPNSTVSTNYAPNFMQYLGFAAQIPNVLFNWLNIFVNLGGDLTKRIVYSILIELVIFIITVVLAMVDSTHWPEAFFWMTIVCVIILNMANGVYQNTIYGMVATLPIKYTGAVVLGSNMSGLFATIISICSKYMFSSVRTAAIYYFITAMLILLVCFDTYFALPLNRFFRYHEILRENESKQHSLVVNRGRPPYWRILKQAAPQLFNVFFTFFVTLAVFPALHSDIKPQPGFIFKDKMFTDITCFLTFNLFAMLGSLLTSWVEWPKPKQLWLPVVLRVLFIPLLLFCNYQPLNTIRILPVLIKNEWIYWFIAILMSFSSGYLSSLGMMYAPQTVAAKYQLTAGMFAAAMLVTGIFSGIIFSFIYPVLVRSVTF